MAVAQPVVQVLLEKIFLFLETEGALVVGAREEFKAISDELESMKSFLRDADRRSETEEEVQTWVAQVRDAAYSVEDIIDEFMYRVDRHFSGGNLSGYVNQIVKFPKNVWVKHQMASKLEEIKANITGIKERHQRYHFHSEKEEGVRMRPHGESPLSAEDDVVGMEGYEKTLLDWLLQPRQRSLLSVLGMGGSGKTTIVAKVYNNKTVKKYFQCSAWVTISQKFQVENLFKRMIKEFYKAAKNLIPTDMNKMDYDDLVETIRDCLRQKRYLIVLEDVWNLDLGLWRRIKAAILPFTSNGSAILLTTRNEDVARFSFGVPKCILCIDPLPENKAWDLFCRRAFLSRHCPQQLEPTARDLVNGCRGLPLTIVVMGNLLSSKDKTELEWKKVCQNPNWELSNNPRLEWCKGILLLSYHDLTYHLKLCFQYCCVFPEDYLIKRKRLIRLWIAEGFVEKIEGKTLEEVADTYLEELVCRSMLEVVTKNHFGRAKRVRLHDLLREVGLSISKRQKFCVLCDRGGEDMDKARRLAIHKCDEKISPHFDMLKLRSLFVFDTETTMLSQSYELPKKLKFLRVLELQGIPIAILPNEIAKLFSLRYLNLRGTRIKKAPKALGKLRNLQTLDVCDTEVKELPKSVEHLQNLRNLIMYHYDLKQSDFFDFVQGTRVPFDIRKLESLQVLASIEADDDMIKQLGNMTQLRRIGITKVRSTQVQQLCVTIKNLHLLRSLFLMASDEHEVLQMDDLKCPPPNLARLTLVGKLKSVPSWFGSLNDLTFLFLKYSQLRENPLNQIHALTNLRRLTLSNAYEGTLLHFQPKWFPMLKMLRLWNLSQLNEVRIENGAMPDIEELWMSGCCKLLMLPQGIEYLCKLKELTLDAMPDQFVNRLRGEGSIDRGRIAHIPQINHYDRKSGKMHRESLS
ncbi:disease resistance protein RPM1 [Telopea speciosissima]|uniref:disease resistance protein RPM1 n=1 Tax=Telopea speciosissima TaxID=54955 RepID=UPI001CC7FC85|nr:disease resistance protein RPM1 [Telopea speciosissima]